MDGGVGVRTGNYPNYNEKYVWGVLGTPLAGGEGTSLSDLLLFKMRLCLKSFSKDPRGVPAKKETSKHLRSLTPSAWRLAKLP